MAKSAELIGRVGRVEEGLVELNQLLSGSALERAELGEVVAGIRRVQRLCSALLNTAAIAAHDLSRAGKGLPPDIVLQDNGSTTVTEARQDTERSRIAFTFPAVAAAMTAGDALLGNVDILARITERMTPVEIDALKLKDKQLAHAACRLETNSFRKRVQRYRDKHREDHGQTEAQQATAETTATVSPTRDKGNYRVHAILDALQGSAVSNAFTNEKRRLAKELGTGHGMDSEQIAAQALTDLIVRGYATIPTDGNNKAVVNVHVITDKQTLTSGPHDRSISETVDGMPVSPATLGQLACDCVIQRIESLPDGHVNVSRSSRTATPTQRAALRALYDSCPISGAPWSQIEVHHVTFATDGGETILENLVPISRRWHHLVHDAGWKLEMDADRTLRLYQPNGTLHKTIDPPVPVLYQQAA